MLQARARALLPFIVVFATFEVYLRVFADPHFYWDAQQYWDLGGSFGAPGHFSLFDFNSTVRGYALPLLNRALATIASHSGLGNVSIVQLFGSLEVALLGTVLVPRLVRVLCPAAEVTPGRILLFNGMVFLFWRDHLGFPLSDFPAATLAIAAFLALSRRTTAGYALGGLAIGLAWNVRPAYVLVLVLAIVLSGLRAGIRRNPMLAVRAVALVLAGIFVASMPQSVINHRLEHSWTPSASHKSVSLLQLTLGMEAQRYETYVGKSVPPLPASTIYWDPSTLALLRQEHIIAIKSYSQYARLIEKYPTEMLAGWARRFFNGLDVRYSTVYINDLGATSEWFSLVNYTLLFAAAVRVLVPAFRRELGKVAWPEVLAFCCAVIPAIPFAVETRYFLPFQLVVYSIVAYGPRTRHAWSELGRSGQVALEILYPVFLLLCVMLSTSTIGLNPSP